MVVVSALVPVAMLGDHDEAPVLVARRRPPVGIIQGPDRQATYMRPYRLFLSVPFHIVDLWLNVHRSENVHLVT